MAYEWDSVSEPLLISNISSYHGPFSPWQPCGQFNRQPLKLRVNYKLVVCFVHQSLSVCARMYVSGVGFSTDAQIKWDNGFGELAHAAHTRTLIAH